jgi:hypothetical protein
VNEYGARLRTERLCGFERFAQARPNESDVSAVSQSRLNLRDGRASGHEYGGVGAQLRGCVGDALGVVPGTCRDNSSAQVLLIQLGYSIKCPAYFERAGALQVFGDQKNLAANQVLKPPRAKRR